MLLKLKKVDDIDVDKINSINELQGKNYNEENSYLYFEGVPKYLTTYKASDNTYVTAWQPRGKSNIKITSPISLNNKSSLIIFSNNNYFVVNFDGGYLKTDTTIYPTLNLPINI